MRTPSPPESTGLNAAFASQLRPQFHAFVAAGWQYAALAYWVYGLNAAIWVAGSDAIPELCLRMGEGCRGAGTAHARYAAASTAIEESRKEGGMASWASGGTLVSRRRLLEQPECAMLELIY